MDGPQEYEVESVTRARVHDKKGKKIAWRYYVKWKGYGWDECTWEPTESFQGGSEHILETFWERIDTGGRDISDATAFKKGEELLISGPPGRKGLKRKANLAQTQTLSSFNDAPSPDGVTISAPPLTTRKRRRVQIATEDERERRKPKRRVSAVAPKSGTSSAKSSRRRRASSPGPRKSASRRLPSASDSQLDADGETDPDIVEVEDELMQVSAEDAEDNNAKAGYPAMASGSASDPRKIAFDDLEHFYTGNPIDIDQNTDEQAAVQKLETRSRPQSPPPIILPQDDSATEPQVPTSPTFSSSDPLFDSPSRLSNEAPEVEKDSIVPHHRARAANPLIKLINTTTLETTGRITAKARLISMHTAAVSSASGLGRGIGKRGEKPGPGRSSTGLLTKNRSSLLTAAKGTLMSVKGKFSGTSMEWDQVDEIEDVSFVRGTAKGDEPLITSWSDEDTVGNYQQQASNSQSNPPSGAELLKLAGLQKDIEALPDYEDDSAAQPQVTSTPVEEKLCNQSLVKVTDGHERSDGVPADSVSGTEEKPWTPAINDPLAPLVAASSADEAVKKNIELAKEHLFPSAQTSFHTFSTAQSSFRSTIFGPLYQGLTANHAPARKNERSTTFKVIFGDGVELPLVLKDCGEIKGQVNDIMIGNYSSKVALFYSAEDACAMVSTFKSDGTARAVLDTSAETIQQERFSTFLQRFKSSHTLVAPVGKEVCVLYSSENVDIAEKLGAPAHLRGLTSTLLISHAAIENQLAYVAAVMKATAL